MARAKTPPKSPLLTPAYPAGSRFEIVARHVVGIEGGHVHHKADKGGETQYGISLRFAKAESGIDIDANRHPDLDLDFDGDIDGADIRALTPEAALNLYWICFWRRLDLGRLPAPIDAAVFDQAVNGGTVAAVKMLQRALNRCEIRNVLKVDGVLGGQTCAAVMVVHRSGQGPDLLRRYRQEAEARYNDIVRADTSQVVFLKGWVARARRLGDV